MSALEATHVRCCVSGMDVVLKIFQMIESNYPEDLKRAYVINGTYWLLVALPIAVL